jgi:hypothetical protein
VRPACNKTSFQFQVKEQLTACVHWRSRLAARSLPRCRFARAACSGVCSMQCMQPQVGCFMSALKKCDIYIIVLGVLAAVKKN